MLIGGAECYCRKCAEVETSWPPHPSVLIEDVYVAVERLL